MNQPSAIRHVLLFENRDTPGMRVGAELRKFAGSMSFRVETASDLLTVREILKTKTVAAAIIDVGRETGDALAALRLLGKGGQAIPLYVYNGFMLPRIAEKSLEYSHVRYFEDHLTFNHFIAMILDELSKKRRGIIHGIALGSFLQLMNNEKFSGQIMVTSKEKRGVLYLRAGQLGSASINGSGSNLALAEMSGWEKVTVEIEERPFGNDAGSFPPQKNQPANEKIDPAIAIDQGTHPGRIDLLRFIRRGKRISVNFNTLASALQGIQGQLAGELLRTDIFLAADGLSLAGWNSHPLACSTFAAITNSLQSSLQACSFPPLGNYYLLDLAGKHLLMIMVTAELHWGMLLKGGKERLGFLLNIVMPEALKALAEATRDEFTV
jgi:hypothetical protein